MNKKERRQRATMERLEAKLPKSLTIPLSQEQQDIWREILHIRKNLGELSETDVAIGNLLYPRFR